MAVDIERLKKSLHLIDIIEEDGIDVYGNGTVRRILCPYHPDRNPSLTIWTNNQTWWCHSCGLGGDVFNWIMHRDNCSFKEAVQKLTSGNYKVHLPIVRRLEPHKSVSPVPGQVVDHYHQRLLSAPNALQWLIKERFWTYDVIVRHRIGLSEHNRFTIPIPDVTSTAYANLLFYSPFNKPKMVPIGAGRKPLPFDVGGLTATNYCILVEGEPDALAIASLGLPAATNTGGCGNAHHVWSVWSGLILASTVFVCYDNDSAGRSATNKVLKVVPHSRALELPNEIGDVTDLVRSVGPTEARRYLESQVRTHSH